MRCCWSEGDPEAEVKPDRMVAPEDADAEDADEAAAARVKEGEDSGKDSESF